jgi:predicted O-linked N-acetylglucosamine transferase (SPINDLY family)
MREPGDIATLGARALELEELGRLAEAEAIYRTVLRSEPGLAAAHFNLGNVLKRLGRPDEAVASFRAAIGLMPGLAAAHYNLANTLRDLGRPDEAEGRYREVLRLEPGHVQARNNLGNALQELGRLDEAEGAFREAILLSPGYAEAHNNLGTVLQHLGRLGEAEIAYRQAIVLSPGYAEAHTNLGIALDDLGRGREAEIAYRQAIACAPDRAALRSNLLFFMNRAESYDADAALEEARIYGAAVSARATPKFTAWHGSRPGGKLRIGFVSGDLRNHPVGYFLESLIAHLDRDAFELFAFSTNRKTDALTARLKPRFREWIPIAGLADRAAAEAIHARGIDVLLDLSGHTEDNRLPVFAHRPAPVQASWLGYFATTGLPEMDGFVGDPHMAPPGEARWFAERIWNLPETWLCLTPPALDFPVSEPPAERNGFATFGCFGNLVKMKEPVAEVWAEILRRVPDSKLFLKSRQLAEPRVIEQTRARFAARGIAADRLILEGPSPRAAYFEAYGRVDMVLDTFPHPGGTTSAEALWMGVPVLTMAGGRFLARLGESIARNVGHADWIARDPADYVRKAVDFARDPRALGGLRAAMRPRVLASPLFDAQRFAAGFGALLKRRHAERTGA